MYSLYSRWATGMAHNSRENAAPSSTEDVAAHSPCLPTQWYGAKPCHSQVQLRRRSDALFVLVNSPARVCAVGATADIHGVSIANEQACPAVEQARSTGANMKRYVRTCSRRSPYRRKTRRTSSSVSYGMISRSQQMLRRRGGEMGLQARGKP